MNKSTRQTLVAYPLRESDGYYYGWFKLNDGHLNPEVVYGSFEPYLLIKIGFRYIEGEDKVPVKIRYIGDGNLDHYWNTITNNIPSVCPGKVHTDFLDVLVCYDAKTHTTYVKINAYVIILHGLINLHFFTKLLSIKITPSLTKNNRETPLSSGDNLVNNYLYEPTNSQIQSNSTEHDKLNDQYHSWNLKKNVNPSNYSFKTHNNDFKLHDINQDYSNVAVQDTLLMNTPSGHSDHTTEKNRSNNDKLMSTTIQSDVPPSNLPYISKKVHHKYEQYNFNVSEYPKVFSNKLSDEEYTPESNSLPLGKHLITNDIGTHRFIDYPFFSFIMVSGLRKHQQSLRRHFMALKDVYDIQTYHETFNRICSNH